MCFEMWFTNNWAKIFETVDIYNESWFGALEGPKEALEKSQI